MNSTASSRLRGALVWLAASAAVLITACATPQATSSNVELPFEEAVAQAYSVDTGAGDTTAAASGEAGPDFATLLASADAAKGEKTFGKCKSCHKIDGGDGTGPHLNGVVGRAVASVAGFAYSDVLKGMGGTWDPEHLNQWLTSPKAMAPGTKMTFAGLGDPQDRANVIAFLNAHGTNLPLPAAPAEAAAPAAGDKAAPAASNATAPAAAGNTASPALATAKK